MLERAPLLRRTLIVNAGFSAFSGLGIALAREPMARWLGVGDPALLGWTGLVLLAFAGHLYWASRRRIPSIEVLYFVASDVLWVVGTAVLVLASPAHLSLSGRWTALAVALVIGGFAVFQARGWSEARRGAR